MQMNFHRKLPIPQEVKKDFPLTESMKQAKESDVRAAYRRDAQGREFIYAVNVGESSTDVTFTTAKGTSFDSYDCFIISSVLSIPQSKGVE